jgi:hypothetical protein
LHCQQVGLIQMYLCSFRRKKIHSNRLNDAGLFVVLCGKIIVLICWFYSAKSRDLFQRSHCCLKYSWATFYESWFTTLANLRCLYLRINN